MQYLTIADDHMITPHDTDKIGLATMQREVGGLIERAFDFPSIERPDHTIDVWVNEEGLLIGMPYNLTLVTDYGLMPLHGPVLVTASDPDGETVGLTERERRQVSLLGDVLVVLPRRAGETAAL